MQRNRTAERQREIWVDARDTGREKRRERGRRENKPKGFCLLKEGAQLVHRDHSAGYCLSTGHGCRGGVS